MPKRFPILICEHFNGRKLKNCEKAVWVNSQWGLCS